MSKITAEDIAKTLSEAKPRPRKKEDPTGYDAWNAEAYYKTLTDLGLKIVKEYFKDKDIAIDITAKAPWSALSGTRETKEGAPVVLNKFANIWKAFTTDVSKELAQNKQVKDAIYMASQQLWLDKQVKEIKEAKELLYQMKYRLIRMKNDDIKVNMLKAFYDKKTKKKNLITFVRLVNRTHYENKYCKPLLREHKKLQEQLASMKGQSKPKEKGEAEPVKTAETLPEKPTIKTVIKAVKDGKIVELLTNPKYLQYVIDSKHFAKQENSDDILMILDEWRKNKADLFNDFADNLELFYSAVKSAAILAKK